MNSVTYKAANQCASGKCPPVIPSPPLAVTRAIPPTMKSMIAMIVVMIVMTILITVVASDHMLPVVYIMPVPSWVIGMVIGMMIGMVIGMIIRMMIGMMLLMIHPALVIV